MGKPKWKYKEKKKLQPRRNDTPVKQLKPRRNDVPLKQLKPRRNDVTLKQLKQKYNNFSSSSEESVSSIKLFVAKKLVPPHKDRNPPTPTKTKSLETPDPQQTGSDKTPSQASLFNFFQQIPVHSVQDLVEREHDLEPENSEDEDQPQIITLLRPQVSAAKASEGRTFLNESEPSFSYTNVPTGGCPTPDFTGFDPILALRDILNMIALKCDFSPILDSVKGPAQVRRRTKRKRAIFKPINFDSMISESKIATTNSTVLSSSVSSSSSESSSQEVSKSEEEKPCLPRKTPPPQQKKKNSPKKVVSKVISKVFKKKKKKTKKNDDYDYI